MIRARATKKLDESATATNKSGGSEIRRGDGIGVTECRLPPIRPPAA